VTNSRAKERGGITPPLSPFSLLGSLFRSGLLGSGLLDRLLDLRESIALHLPTLAIDLDLRVEALKPLVRDESAQNRACSLDGNLRTACDGRGGHDEVGVLTKSLHNRLSDGLVGFLRLRGLLGSLGESRIELRDGFLRVLAQSLVNVLVLDDGGEKFSVSHGIDLSPTLRSRRAVFVF